MHMEKMTKPSKRKWLAIIGSSLLLIIVSIISAYYILPSRNSVPLPPQSTLENINNDLPFYYPSKLPEGFSADEDTIGTQDNVTVYQIAYGNNQRMFVSIQPIPDNFDFVGFYNQTLQAQEFEANNGEAYIGSLNDNSVVSLKTADAWILLNAPGGIGASEMQDIARSLQAVN